MSRQSFNQNWTVGPNSDIFDMRPNAARKAITLPHDAMIEGTRTPDAVGKGKKAYFPGGLHAYIKKFDVPEVWRDKRISFEFEGVYMNAKVYLNGDFVAQHPYGYSRFFVQADKLLRYGQENEIKVLAFTGDDSRWYSGAGIYRNVWLHVSEPLHLAPDGVQVTTVTLADTHAVMQADTMLMNEGMHPEKTVLRTELVDPFGAVVAQDLAPVTVFPGEKETLRQRLRVEAPACWSPDSPSLYVCRTTLLSSEAAGGADVSMDTEPEILETRFGIRVLSLDVKDGLCINGTPVKLRGTCIHHDNGVLGAATIARAEERRVEILKEAGFNAIRSAHHPMSVAMLDACDRLGMLVMDEAFDMWTLHKSPDDYARHFPTWWEKDIEAMVAKDYNHPSVILYSIGNEIPETGTPAGATWGRKLTQKIRSMDATRYTLNSLNLMLAVMEKLQKHLAAMITGDINTAMTDFGEAMKDMAKMEMVTEDTKESFNAVDIAGYNYADGRYEMDRELFPNRVICGSETFPRDIAENWRLVMENPHIIGDFTWTGWDYLGEAGIGKVTYGDAPAWTGGSPYPWLTAWCGDVDITGFRRPLSHYREIVFGLRTEPYLAVLRPQHYGEKTTTTPWGWSDSISSWSWPGFEGKPCEVEVYANADEVALHVNGNEVGRARPDPKRACLFRLETVYAPGELTAIAYRAGQETGRTSLCSAGSDVQLQVKADRTTIGACGQDLSYIAISLTDDAGVVHSLADRPVRVAVSGCGHLQGLGSANPATEASFLADTTTTFDGRALAVIRPTGVGNIEVRVEADGCEPQVVVIVAAD